MMNTWKTSCATGFLPIMLALTSSAPAAVTDVRINEVYADHAGTDDAEFIELHGLAGQDLTGLTVLVIEGQESSNEGAIDRVWDLSGQTIPPDGLFVMGDTGSVNVDFDIGISNRIENGTETILLVQGFTGNLNDDVDADDDGVADAGYTDIGTIIDSVGMAGPSDDDGPVYYDAPVLGPLEGSGDFPAGVARRTDAIPANDTDTSLDWCFTSSDAVPPDPGPGADGFDAASPGDSNSYDCPVPIPIAEDGRELLTKNDPPVTITLVATDPVAGPPDLTYTIVSGPDGTGPSHLLGLGGTLIDHHNGNADVTSGGTLATNEVTFVPATDKTGWFAFTSKANDGENDSNIATVNLLIQDTGGLVMTEIMYDPANVNADSPSDETDWEWIEVYNPTASSVYLHSLYDSTMNPAHENNVYYREVPAGQTRIIMHQGCNSALATEWSASVTEDDLLDINPTGPPGGLAFSNAGDTLSLFDTYGRLVDVVAYANGDAGWPQSNDRGSIFLEHDHLSTTDNDDGNHWKLSVAGANGVYATPEDPCSPGDSDEGSPMILPSPPTVVLSPPTASSQVLDANLADGAFDIMLTAEDPDPDPLTFIIVDTPIRCKITTGSGGTLSDPGNGGAVVNPGDPLVGDQVTYHPPPDTSGIFDFAFKARDGTADSNIAYVTINLQDTDRVTITEIMYDPRNEPDGDWEWVEVTNLTESLINLHTVTTDDDFDTTGNLAGESIPAHSTMVIAAGDIPGGGRTLNDFITEWSPLTANDVVAVNAANWPQLSNHGDVLQLFADDGSLLDAVVYDDCGDWPCHNDVSSIYLELGAISTLDNDDGNNWALSVDGVEGAYATPETPGDPADSDVGSPAILPTGAPVAEDDTIIVNEGTASVVITLAATDPVPGPTTPPIFSIVTGPNGVAPTTGSGGSLLDHHNGNADVTGGGTLAADEVTFVPGPGLSGIYAFTFKANDGQVDSNVATVTIWLQGADTVVITEIMYDPDNQPDNDWEWIEITNLTASPIDLHSLLDANQNTLGNLAGTTVPAGATVIITKDDVAGGRTLTEFVTEWTPLDVAAVIAIDPNTFPSLNQSGDTLLLLAANGSLLDVVMYENGMNDWPAADGFSSIYVIAGNISTFDNDTATHWALSVVGVDGAYATPEDPGLPTDIDIGSPAILPAWSDCQITSWASVHHHGAVSGELAISLDASATGSAVVSETRRDGVVKLEVDFNTDVSGLVTGTVEAEDLTHGGTIAASDQYLINGGTTLVIEFDPGLPDEACYEIDLAGRITGLTGDTDCRVKVLAGNTNGDDNTNLIDMAQVKSMNGADPIVPGNARFDVNTDGNINLIDMALVKSLNGGAIP